MCWTPSSSRRLRACENVQRVPSVVAVLLDPSPPKASSPTQTVARPREICGQPRFNGAWPFPLPLIWPPPPRELLPVCRRRLPPSPCMSTRVRGAGHTSPAVPARPPSPRLYMSLPETLRALQRPCLSPWTSPSLSIKLEELPLPSMAASPHQSHEPRP